MSQDQESPKAPPEPTVGVLDKDEFLTGLAQDSGHGGTRRIGPVRLEAKLSKGGMGVVYKGRHLKLDIDVAVKFLFPHLAENNPEYVIRFEREARMAAKLNNENLVRVFDVDSERNYHYVVMELVCGETARDRVQRKGALAEDEAVEIILGATRGLEAAHRRGIVHRDIKPDNIMIDASGIVKLADLGIAKMLADSEGELTQPGFVMGTPSFMPPEQLSDVRSVGLSGDVYSMGATLYFLLGAKAPFAGNMVEIFQKVAKDPFPDLRKDRPGISERLFEVLETCTRRDPLARYPDASSLLEALEAAGTRRVGLGDALTGTVTAVAKVSTPPVRRVGAIRVEIPPEGGATVTSAGTAHARKHGRAKYAWAAAAAFLVTVGVAGGILWQSLDGRKGQESGGSERAAAAKVVGELPRTPDVGSSSNTAAEAPPAPASPLPAPVQATVDPIPSEAAPALEVARAPDPRPSEAASPSLPPEAEKGPSTVVASSGADSVSSPSEPLRVDVPPSASASPTKKGAFLPKSKGAPKGATPAPTKTAPPANAAAFQAKELQAIERVEKGIAKAKELIALGDAKGAGKLLEDLRAATAGLPRAEKKRAEFLGELKERERLLGRARELIEMGDSTGALNILVSRPTWAECEGEAFRLRVKAQLVAKPPLEEEALKLFGQTCGSSGAATPQDCAAAYRELLSYAATPPANRASAESWESRLRFWRSLPRAPEVPGMAEACAESGTKIRAGYLGSFLEVVKRSIAAKDLLQARKSVDSIDAFVQKEDGSTGLAEELRALEGERTRLESLEAETRDWDLLAKDLPSDTEAARMPLEDLRRLAAALDAFLVAHPSGERLKQATALRAQYAQRIAGTND